MITETVEHEDILLIVVEIFFLGVVDIDKSIGIDDDVELVLLKDSKYSRHHIVVRIIIIVILERDVLHTREEVAILFEILEDSSLGSFDIDLEEINRNIFHSITEFHTLHLVALDIVEVHMLLLERVSRSSFHACE